MDVCTGTMYESQIDHLLICPHGVFLIETKYWNGSTYIWSTDRLRSAVHMEKDDRLGSNGVVILNIDKSNTNRHSREKREIAEYCRISDIQEKARGLSNYFRKHTKTYNLGIFVHTALAFVVGENQRVYLDNVTDLKQGLFCDEISFLKEHRFIVFTFNLGDYHPTSPLSDSENHLLEVLRDYIPRYVQGKPNTDTPFGVQRQLKDFKINRVVECLENQDDQGRLLHSTGTCDAEENDE